eukprot:SAG31_NODE_16582_length_703_cov_1.266556_1_plen_97_part_10
MQPSGPAPLPQPSLHSLPAVPLGDIIAALASGTGSGAVRTNEIDALPAFLALADSTLLAASTGNDVVAVVQRPAEGTWRPCQTFSLPRPKQQVLAPP